MFLENSNLDERVRRYVNLIRTVWSSGGIRNEEKLLEKGTFQGYYILQAYALSGEYPGGIDLIRKYWGGMLDLEATSFWEHFDYSWLENAGRIDEMPTQGKVDVYATYGDGCFKGHRNSFCHGWASGPSAWLLEHVLGVRVGMPGAKEVEIFPHLCGLKKVKGRFPTPYGIIEVEHKVDASGKVKSNVQAPQGIILKKQDE